MNTKSHFVKHGHRAVCNMKKILLFSLLNFAIIASSPAADLFWSGDGASQGGAGTWNTTSARWGGSAGGPFSTIWNNANEDSATFGGTGGAVAIATGGVTVNKITILSSGYSFTGGPVITFAGANAGIDVVIATNVILSANYTGSLLTKSGVGRLTLNNANNTMAKYLVTGGWVSTAAISRFGTAPGALVSDFLTLNGGGWGIDTGSQVLAATQGITVGAGGGIFGSTSLGITMTINSPITGVGGISVQALPFTHTAGAMLTLANTANNYQGSTTVSNGSIRLGASGVIPDTSLVSLQGGTLDMAGFNETVASLTGSGSITNSGGVLTVNSPSGQTYSGVIRGTGSVVKNGSGVLSLSGGSTFTGGFQHNAGTVRVNNNTALGAANSAVALANNVILSTTGGTGRTLTHSWSVNGNVTLGQASGGTGALNLAGTINLGGAPRTFTIANSSNRISANISNGGFIKAGNGTVTLSGNNTYAGGTTVNAGTLNLEGSSPIGIGPLTINGGKVMGSGANVAFIVNSGGSISPGSSPGTMTSGSQTWEGGGQYIWEVNDVNGTAGADPGWDQLVITGGLTINASSGNKFIIDVNSLTLANVAGMANGFNSAQDYTFAIATISGGIIGFDANVFDIQTDNLVGDGGPLGTFSLTLDANVLNLRYTAVPEPSTLAFGALGLLAIASRTIRRRK